MLIVLPLSQVICLDNFFTGTRENVAHLLDNPNFELIRHDVVNPILLEVDEIYHLACPASPVHYKYVYDTERPDADDNISRIQVTYTFCDRQIGTVPALLLQIQPNQDNQDQLLGHHEHAGTCQANKRKVPPHVHIRGVW